MKQRRMGEEERKDHAGKRGKMKCDSKRKKGKGDKGEGGGQ